MPKDLKLTKPLREHYLTEPGFDELCYEYENCEDCPKWDECSMEGISDTFAEFDEDE